MANKTDSKEWYEEHLGLKNGCQFLTGQYTTSFAQVAPENAERKKIEEISPKITETAQYKKSAKRGARY